MFSLSEQRPFIFERPVEPDQVIDRDAESRRLISLADGRRYTRMAAPRRYGKTSLIGKALAEALEDGVLVAMVNLYGVASLADFTIRLERAFARQLQGEWRRRVGAFFRSLDLGLSLGPVGISARLDRRTDSLPGAHALLATPFDVASRSAGRGWIVFDEFQDVARVEGLEALVRSHIEGHSSHVSYTFAGSEPGMMEAIFGTRAKPLYGQAESVTLGPLHDRDAAPYIEQRFADTGRSAGEALSTLLHTAQGHPQRLMLLAHHLWEQTALGATASTGEWSSALDAARAYTAPEFSATWRLLSLNEQRSLRAVALYDGQPYTAAALETLSLARGSAAKAIARLASRGEIRAVDAGCWRFVDPLFALWARERFGPGSSEPADS